MTPSFLLGKYILLPFLSVMNPRVQYFQFRFIHRVIGVNAYLYKIKLSDTPLCTFCQEVDETLNHLFWSCYITSDFWKEAINLCFNENFNISGDNVMFGYVERIQHPVNFFILHAKYYLFICKQENRMPCAASFHRYFKYVKDIECLILKNRGNNERLDMFQLFSG